MNNQLQNPSESHYDNDVMDYPIYQCSSCNDNHPHMIYFNHLGNGNICEKCLTEEDLPFILGMSKREFTKYQNKVRNQLPSNPL